MSDDAEQRELDRELAAYFIELLNSDPTVRVALADAASGRTSDTLGRLEALLAGVPANLQALSGDMVALRNAVGRLAGSAGAADQARLQSTLDQLLAEVRATGRFTDTAVVAPGAAGHIAAPADSSNATDRSAALTETPLQRHGPSDLARSLVRTPAGVGLVLGLLVAGAGLGLGVARWQAARTAATASAVPTPAAPAATAPADALNTGWKRLLAGAREDPGAELAKLLEAECTNDCADPAGSIRLLKEETRSSLIFRATEMLEGKGHCPAPDASAGPTQTTDGRQQRTLACLAAMLGREP